MMIPTLYTYVSGNLFLIVFIIPSIRVKCCITNCPIAVNTKGQLKRKTTTPGISTIKP